jgi:hypothetical protein
MYELVFIGAGPQCLTTLLRLLEPLPDCSIDEKARGVVSKGRLATLHRKQRCDAGYRTSLKVRRAIALGGCSSRLRLFCYMKQ